MREGVRVGMRVCKVVTATTAPVAAAPTTIKKRNGLNKYET